MNIIICENLKELRKNKNNTQEDLAAFLDVSISAVSKWERGECYPDIELLPKLAAYYNISVDDLLGVGEINKRKRIEEYAKKSHHFGNIGDEKINLALWREAQKEFPNDWDVLHGLSYALYALHDKENEEEIIEIGDKILAECTTNSYRYGAMQVLCFLYGHKKDTEKAKEYANMAPSLWVSQNVLLSHVLEGEELIKHCQGNISAMLDLFAREIFVYGRNRGGIKGEEAKHAIKISIKLYEMIYENGDVGFYACRLAENYGLLAKIAAEQGNKEETIEYLSNNVKYAVKFDIDEGYAHTSLLVNRLSYSPQDLAKD